MPTTTAAPLAAACREGDVRAVAALLRGGASVHARDPSYGGCTALHAAAQRCDVPVLHLLLAFGADVVDDWSIDADRFRDTPLLAALLGGAPFSGPRAVRDHDARTVRKRDAVLALLRSGADPAAERFLKSPVRAAMADHDVVLVRALTRARGFHVSPPREGWEVRGGVDSADLKAALYHALECGERGMYALVWEAALHPPRPAAPRRRASM